jgi:hypothetical protein
LVDFFCDPAGTREEVNTALVNKRRGFNAYFPMPFRRSAKVELLYDGPLEPGEQLWKNMPCYSYIIYRQPAKLSRSTGYFHASWRQEGLLLGKQDYVALDTKGQGKFIGWNVTMRKPGRSDYPVDQNEKFYVDGETIPSVEFQGIEDSFGFSWGFPATESQFPLTGFYNYFKGAMAYRFFLSDAIGFHRSLRVTIGFGQNEHPMFKSEYSKPGNTLQLSSTVYWYQQEPHSPLPPLPPATARAPAPEEPFWPDKEPLPSVEELRQRHVMLRVHCGRQAGETIFAEPDFGAAIKKGYAYESWSLPVYHCRADKDEVEVTLTVKPGTRGTARLFVIDPDHFEGGRRQRVAVNGTSLGEIADFVEGRWLGCPLDASQTAQGSVRIQAFNARSGANAVISIIEWIQD